MSLRPSGCGGRSDAVPPHVEKRRRLSRPSSFIMRPAGAPPTGGKEWGVGKENLKVEGRRVSGYNPIFPAQLVCKRISQPATHTHTNRNTERFRQQALDRCSRRFALRFLQPTAFFLPLSLRLPLSHSICALWVCMKAAACKYLITNKLSPSHSLSSGWVGEPHLSLKTALMFRISSFTSAQSLAASLSHYFRFKGTLHRFATLLWVSHWGGTSLTSTILIIVKIFLQLNLVSSFNPLTSADEGKLQEEIWG